MKKLFVAIGLLFALAGSVQAQTANCRATANAPTYQEGNAVPLSCDLGGTLRAQGAGGTSTPTTVANSTIAVTNTFQAALAASTTRKGCLLQNQGTHTMFVFFGAIGSATTSNALQIASGQTISCNAGNIVLTDAVNITGTATDAFVVNSQ